MSIAAPDAPAPVAVANPAQAAVWTRRLAPYRTADNRTAVGELALTLGLFAAVWVAMAWAARSAWWLPLPLAPVAGFLLVRLFIVQHDCGHGSFFSSTRANDLTGFWLGVLTLTPYRYWKRTHAIHHATSGDLDRRTYGDIITLTVAEYRARPAWRRLAYRLYRNPVVMFVVGPTYQFVLKHRLPLDAPLSWTREWVGVMSTNLAVAAAVVGVGELVGWRTFLLVHLPILVAGLPIGIWMFYVQHQFEDTYWARSASWDYYAAALAGSSFYDIGPVLHWLTGNIGYHHIHHLASRIPFYRLADCYREVAELHQARRVTLRASVGCLRLKLWDEERGRMVGWVG